MPRPRNRPRQHSPHPVAAQPAPSPHPAVHQSAPSPHPAPTKPRPPIARHHTAYAITCATAGFAFGHGRDGPRVRSEDRGIVTVHETLKRCTMGNTRRRRVAVLASLGLVSIAFTAIPAGGSASAAPPGHAHASPHLKHAQPLRVNALLDGQDEDNGAADRASRRCARATSARRTPTATRPRTSTRSSATASCRPARRRAARPRRTRRPSRSTRPTRATSWPARTTTGSSTPVRAATTATASPTRRWTGVPRGRTSRCRT